MAMSLAACRPCSAMRRSVPTSAGTSPLARVMRRTSTMADPSTPAKSATTSAAWCLSPRPRRNGWRRVIRACRSRSATTTRTPATSRRSPPPQITPTTKAICWRRTGTRSSRKRLQATSATRLATVGSATRRRRKGEETKNSIKLSLLGLGALFLVTAQAGEDRPSSNFGIVSLSNRADLISGGDALVEVRVPKSVALNAVRLSLNGHDVTGAFTANAAARTLRGLVSGLVEGRNDFVAGESRGGREARLVITNHPIGGPVLLGSQTTPWICATPTPVAESGNTPASNASGLTTFAVDAQCNIATEYKLFYRTTTAGCSSALPDPSPPAPPPTNNCFKPYTPGSVPADLAMTTTGVPYIVRVERGTINRGIYDIAVLFDPARPWSALSPQPQWNGKVVYTFGVSTGQPRLQFRSEQNWADDAALSRGFMVVDNSLTDSLYNSNRVLNAETLMMMKEHIVDTYGEIKYTVGNGCSGGSIQQNTAASIFPGLLDGIQPSCDYPDSITTGMEVT